jgi:cell division protein FtsI/penicillin-binding protein 2
MRAPNNYQRFLAAGLGCYIGLQSILIIGGNLRLLPLTGVTLPFVSYGGSSLLTTFFALGMLMVISSNQEALPPEMPRLRPYLAAGAGFALAFFLLGLTAGWWAVIRSDDLQFRTDNLRWTIHARYVPRGSLLDRSGTPIAVTTGESGSFKRTLLYPALGTTVGYSDPLFGKGGLEASLDGYLTGLQGSASSTIWLAEWMYGQPPPGLDVRLSIDLKLQSVLDQNLDGHTGGGVILNMKTGEILALASSPGFDPNLMSEKMDEWRNDPSAPLLNRVTQGTYPPGTILGPFLFADVQPVLTEVPDRLTYSLGDKTLTCARPPAQPLDWQTIIGAGCPGGLVELGSRLSNTQLQQLLEEFGFFTEPDFELPTAAPSENIPISDSVLTSLGQSGIKITPLQLALAVAQLSNQGNRPSPRLASAVKTPLQGWVVLPATNGASVSGRYASPYGIKTADTGELPVWDAVGAAQTEDGKPVTWYISGTVDSWQGSPLALVLAMEENAPELAVRIGRQTMSSAINP